MAKLGLDSIRTTEIEVITSISDTYLVPIFVDQESKPNLVSVTNLNSGGILDDNNIFSGDNDFTGAFSLDGTALTATGAEINKVCDASGRIVASTDEGTLSLTEALHSERIVYVDDVDGIAITLPAATGTGNRYKVVLKSTITSNSSTIKVASASDSFLGMCFGVDDDADAGYAWKAETADDTVTLDGSATGGKAGDWFSFLDIATGLFLVEGNITQSGGSEATPFSATVS